MTMSQHQQPVAVASWEDDATAGYHDAAWTAWLHGSVGTLHRAGRVLLVVPMAVLTPAAVALALRLYSLGATSRLD